MSVNKVTLQGRLTHDPIIGETPRGVCTAGITIATNRTFEDSKGNQRSEANYTDCDAFDDRAEQVKAAQKGDEVRVEGRLKLEKWNRDGQERSKTKVVIETFTLISKANSAIKTT